jgi:hypothetical protein
MPKKPNSKNLSDVKMLIAAVSVTATLGLWNLFAANASTLAESTQVPADPLQPSAVEGPALTQSLPSFIGKIILGGFAPQPRVITRSGAAGRGAQPFTQTRSS